MGPSAKGSMKGQMGIVTPIHNVIGHAQGSGVRRGWLELPEMNANLNRRQNGNPPEACGAIQDD